jgi:nucleoside-diphosphate-sugar epimerase
MRILITGGAGFLGARLARTLLQRGVLDGRVLEKVVLADLSPPAPDLAADARVEARLGPLLDHTAQLGAERYDGVFHLASAVSAECEADFELGLRSNIDTTRALLDAFRLAGHAPRLVFSSSIAVYGPDPAVPLPSIVTDTTLPTPQTSYGTHKLIGEHLVADYTRKGYIDGRAARLMTVTVRPGKPNGAASSFFSSIIREPLAGREAVCPVSPEVAHPVASPARTIDGLIKVYEASRAAFHGRTALNLPALNVTVGQMLDALEAVAGSGVRSLVRFERDERIAAIVAGWPAAAAAGRAHALGLSPDPSFTHVVHEYIADCERQQDADSMLRGLARRAAAENVPR